MNTYNSSSLVCQVCGKHGHSAHKCYHLFDLTYQNSSPLHNKQAFLATQNWDNDWHDNTGATHHVTNDLTTLNLKDDDYIGLDQLQVAMVKVCISLKLAIPPFIFLLTPFV